MQTNNHITITTAQMGWVVGAIGICCAALCLAMVWTTRDVSRMQADQLHWLQSRVNKLEERADLWKAYQDSEVRK